MINMDPLPNVKQDKIKLSEINEYLTCKLCKGYFIDATTISECLHSFCRSCIIKFLQENSHCPICEMIINKAKPNIKLDKTLQDIVYKLVPELFINEMARRQRFYRNRPEAAAKATPEERGIDTERTIFNPKDAISLSIEYISDDSSPGAISVPEAKVHEESPQESQMKRFLQCPGNCRIEVLKKFVQNKYSVDVSAFHIEILYKRVPLPNHYTLIDIAYIYSWKRNEPMKFFFRILDKTSLEKAEKVVDHIFVKPPKVRESCRRKAKKESEEKIYTNITLNRSNNVEIITRVEKVSQRIGQPITYNVFKKTVKNNEEVFSKDKENLNKVDDFRKNRPKGISDERELENCQKLVVLSATQNDSNLPEKIDAKNSEILEGNEARISNGEDNSDASELASRLGRSVFQKNDSISTLEDFRNNKNLRITLKNSKISRNDDSKPTESNSIVLDGRSPPRKSKSNSTEEHDSFKSDGKSSKVVEEILQRDSSANLTILKDNRFNSKTSKRTLLDGRDSYVFENNDLSIFKDNRISKIQDDSKPMEDTVLDRNEFFESNGKNSKPSSKNSKAPLASSRNSKFSQRNDSNPIQDKNDSRNLIIFQKNESNHLDENSYNDLSIFRDNRSSTVPSRDISKPIQNNSTNSNKNDDFETKTASRNFRIFDRDDSKPSEDNSTALDGNDLTIFKDNRSSKVPPRKASQRDDSKSVQNRGSHDLENNVKSRKKSSKTDRHCENSQRDDTKPIGDNSTTVLNRNDSYAFENNDLSIFKDNCKDDSKTISDNSRVLHSDLSVLKDNSKNPSRHSNISQKTDSNLLHAKTLQRDNSGKSTDLNRNGSHIFQIDSKVSSRNSKIRQKDESKPLENNDLSIFKNDYQRDDSRIVDTEINDLSTSKNNRRPTNSKISQREDSRAIEERSRILNRNDSLTFESNDFKDNRRSTVPPKKCSRRDDSKAIESMLSDENVFKNIERNFETSQEHDAHLLGNDSVNFQRSDSSLLKDNGSSKILPRKLQKDDSQPIEENSRVLNSELSPFKDNSTVPSRNLKISQRDDTKATEENSSALDESDSFAFGRSSKIPSKNSKISQRNDTDPLEENSMVLDRNDSCTFEKDSKISLKKSKNFQRNDSNPLEENAMVLDKNDSCTFEKDLKISSRKSKSFQRNDSNPYEENSMILDRKDSCTFEKDLKISSRKSKNFQRNDSNPLEENLMVLDRNNSCTFEKDSNISSRKSKNLQKDDSNPHEENLMILNRNSEADSDPSENDSNLQTNYLPFLKENGNATTPSRNSTISQRDGSKPIEASNISSRNSKVSQKDSKSTEGSPRIHNRNDFYENNDLSTFKDRRISKNLKVSQRHDSKSVEDNSRFSDGSDVDESGFRDNRRSKLIENNSESYDFQNIERNPKIFSKCSGISQNLFRNDSTAFKDNTSTKIPSRNSEISRRDDSKPIEGNSMVLNENDSYVFGNDSKNPSGNLNIFHKDDFRNGSSKTPSKSSKILQRGKLKDIEKSVVLDKNNSYEDDSNFRGNNSMNSRNSKISQKDNSKSIEDNSRALNRNDSYVFEDNGRVPSRNSKPSQNDDSNPIGNKSMNSQGDDFSNANSSNGSKILQIGTGDVSKLLQRDDSNLENDPMKSEKNDSKISRILQRDNLKNIEVKSVVLLDNGKVSSRDSRIFQNEESNPLGNESQGNNLSVLKDNENSKIFLSDDSKRIKDKNSSYTFENSSKVPSRNFQLPKDDSNDSIGLDNNDLSIFKDKSSLEESTLRDNKSTKIRRDDSKLIEGASRVLESGESSFRDNRSSKIPSTNSQIAQSDDSILIEFNSGFLDGDDSYAFENDESTFRDNESSKDPSISTEVSQRDDSKLIEGNSRVLDGKASCTFGNDESTFRDNRSLTIPSKNSKSPQRDDSQLIKDNSRVLSGNVSCSFGNDESAFRDNRNLRNPSRNSKKSERDDSKLFEDNSRVLDGNVSCTFGNDESTFRDNKSLKNPSRNSKLSERDNSKLTEGNSRCLGETVSCTYGNNESAFRDNRKTPSRNSKISERDDSKLIENNLRFLDGNASGTCGNDESTSRDNISLKNPSRNSKLSERDNSPIEGNSRSSGENVSCTFGTDESAFRDNRKTPSRNSKISERGDSTLIEGNSRVLGGNVSFGNDECTFRDNKSLKNPSRNSKNSERDDSKLFEDDSRILDGNVSCTIGNDESTFRDNKSLKTPSRNSKNSERDDSKLIEDNSRVLDGNVSCTFGNDESTFRDNRSLKIPSRNSKTSQRDDSKLIEDNSKVLDGNPSCTFGNGECTFRDNISLKIPSRNSKTSERDDSKLIEDNSRVLDGNPSCTFGNGESTFRDNISLKIPSRSSKTSERDDSKLIEDHSRNNRSLKIPSGNSKNSEKDDSKLIEDNSVNLGESKGDSSKLVGDNSMNFDGKSFSILQDNETNRKTSLENSKDTQRDNSKFIGGDKGNTNLSVSQNLTSSSKVPQGNDPNFVENKSMDSHLFERDFQGGSSKLNKPSKTLNLLNLNDRDLSLPSKEKCNSEDLERTIASVEIKEEPCEDDYKSFNSFKVEGKNPQKREIDHYNFEIEEATSPRLETYKSRKTPKSEKTESGEKEKSEFLKSIQLKARNVENPGQLFLKITQKRKNPSPIKSEPAKRVKRKTSPPQKIVVQPNVPKGTNEELKQIFSNCKFNIPSSLSITLKETNAEDDNKNLKLEPVKNYIEILKLPDQEKFKSRSAPNLTNKSFQTTFEDTIAQNLCGQKRALPMGTHGAKKPRFDFEKFKNVPPNLIKCEQVSAKLHSPSLGMNFTVSVNQNVKTHFGKLDPKFESFKKKKGSPVKVEKVENFPKPQNHVQIGQHVIGIVKKSPTKCTEKLQIPKKPQQMVPILPKPANFDANAAALQSSLTTNQIMEKYNIQNLAQLTASLNFNPMLNMQPPPMVLQQAILKQFELQNRQNWQLSQFQTNNKYLPPANINTNRIISKEN